MKQDFDFLDSDDASLDLTSLIDVLFLLLAFFILAATFASPGLNVDLPEARTAQGVPDKKDTIVLSISSDGIFYHDGKEVSMEELAVVLGAYPVDSRIVFNVDEKAPFDSFIKALDEMKYKGYSNFFINSKVKKIESE